MIPRLAAPFAMLVLILGVASCGGDDAAAPTRSSLERALARASVSANPASVVADDDYFQPKALKVRQGTAVTFSNEGRRIHDVIPLDGGTFRIDTDELRPGMSTTVTLDRPGTFRYFCSIHGTATRGMRGIIEVVREPVG
jgi:plastocyanin